MRKFCDRFFKAKFEADKLKVWLGKNLEETFSQIMRALLYLTTSEAFILFYRVVNACTHFPLEIV